MDITKIQPTTLQLTQAVADSYHSNAAGGGRSAVVERNATGYRAYVVPSLPGVSASGSSVTQAETNLGLVLDLLA